jgi:hypothetical protein
MSYTTADHALARKWQPRVIVLGDANVVVQERGI